MPSRSPYEAKIGAITYQLREKPSFGNEGMSFTPTQDSSGAEAKGAEQAMIYLARINGLQLIMKNHSLSALQATLSAGRQTVVLKIRSGSAIETFTLADTLCTTQEVVEQDGIVSLDFQGGTASGG